MHRSVVSRAKKSPLPSISDVTHGEHDFDTQALLVFAYDTLGPPSFQRSPRIPSLEELLASHSVVFISSICGTFERW